LSFINDVSIGQALVSILDHACTSLHEDVECGKLILFHWDIFDNYCILG